MEIWLAVSDCEGLYEVSSVGRVRSVDRVVETKSGVFRKMKSKILSPSRSGEYDHVAISISGLCKTRKVHHLVAESFIGPRPEGFYVCHIDGNPRNNNVSNLKYGLPQENTRDSVRHGTHAESAKTHCKYGHPFSPENTRVRKKSSGGTERACITCMKRRSIKN